MVSEAQQARNEAIDAAWKAFKDNPSWSTYKAWVKSGYSSYAEGLEEQDLGVGSDIRLLATEAAYQTQEAAVSALKSTLDFTFNVVGPELLGVIEGAGVALVKGVDKAFDAVRKKFIEGKEPDIVAGFTIGMLAILTGVYIWNSAKNTANVL